MPKGDAAVFPALNWTFRPFHHLRKHPVHFCSVGVFMRQLMIAGKTLLLEAS